MPAAPAAAASPLATLLPPVILGWAPREPDGVYDASTLYDYIDGGAEVYLNLDVRKVLGRRYEKDGAPGIIADIFEMGTPSDAFGAYHHDLRDDGEAAGIGAESEYESGALAFWKGRYFVSLIALEETPEVGEALRALGRQVAAAITEDASPPALLALLPAPAANQVHFFRTHLSLNRYRFLSDENVLGLGQTTEGILARCRPGAGGTAAGCAVLIVRYPSADGARSGLDGLRRVVAPGMDAGGVAAAADGSWYGARVDGRILAAVLSGGSRAEVLTLLEDVMRRAREMP